MELLSNLSFQFDSLPAFLWMQGHGPYVWAAYLITVIGLVYLMLIPRIKTKQFFKKQKAIQVRLATSNTEY